MDKSKVVVIKKFSTAGEAMIYQTLLASNGIECELINETAFVQGTRKVPVQYAKRVVGNQAGRG